MGHPNTEFQSQKASLYDDIRYAMSWRLGYGAPQSLSPAQLEHVEDETKRVIEHGMQEGDEAGAQESGLDLADLLERYRALRAPL